ncbi:hypothetical protein M422DRAFT_54814 [Sphaerobolus stellatus SS14]|uniref:Unplaced genomic scaffold SPHSTscaffold_244, whole genome shotgun sequence n=1 Tax=Sphaerobolus stellatus (strain SS14) TaxID=990650 RepID=A0A0C9TF89_SPHS4|nr:hypothetical protein M422DRAFT_54814 [Sphaerobolus stellatus SS14]
MAVSSAQMACNFWNKIFSEKLCHSLDFKENIPDDVKPVKKMPVTYSGKSRSSIFAKKKKELKKAAEGSHRLERFFQLAPKQQASAPDPECEPQQELVPPPQSQNKEASDIANAGETIVGSSGCPILMSVPQNDPFDKFQAAPMPDLTPEETVTIRSTGLGQPPQQ